MENQFSPAALQELGHRFDALPRDVQLKGARYAGRKAANIIAEAARQNAGRLDDPETAENIAANIVVRFSSRTFRRNGNVAFRIGVLGGAQQYADTKQNRRKGRVGQAYATDGNKNNPGGDTWYWRQVEFGNKNSAPHPFMRPAMQQNIDPAISEFARQLNGWMDRYFKKLPPIRG